MNTFNDSIGYKLFNTAMDHHRTMWDQSPLIQNIDSILNLTYDDLNDHIPFTPPQTPKNLKCPNAPYRLRSPSFESSTSQSSLPYLPTFNISSSTDSDDSALASTTASSHYDSEDHDINSL